MPRISTDNYDTVASWNGSQDLFIVEQPDGTKVATPAMVKQFIEAGDFEATGEVKDGHGNILNGLVGQLSELDDEINTLISGKVPYINCGTITASSINDALGKAWDAINVYYKPVLVRFDWYGSFMAMMFKYDDSRYGMAMGMRYASTDIYVMHVNNGTKAYATK